MKIFSVIIQTGYAFVLFHWMLTMVAISWDTLDIHFDVGSDTDSGNMVESAFLLLLLSRNAFMIYFIDKMPFSIHSESYRMNRNVSLSEWKKKLIVSFFIFGNQFPNILLSIFCILKLLFQPFGRFFGIRNGALYKFM